MTGLKQVYYCYYYAMQAVAEVWDRVITDQLHLWGFVCLCVSVCPHSKRKMVELSTPNLVLHCVSKKVLTLKRYSSKL